MLIAGRENWAVFSEISQLGKEFVEESELLLVEKKEKMVALNVDLEIIEIQLICWKLPFSSQIKIPEDIIFLALIAFLLFDYLLRIEVMIEIRIVKIKI